MPSLSAYVHRSASAKAATIAILILVLLIPIGMIKGVIDDRRAIGLEAQHDIMRSWGGEQLVAGPILVMPYTATYRHKDGSTREVNKRAYVLPEKLYIDAEVRPEIRYRGLHKVPVYRARVHMSGRLGTVDPRLLGLDPGQVNWDKAYIALVVSDARAITTTPEISLGQQSIRFQAGGRQIDGLPVQIVAPVRGLNNTETDAASLDFELVLTLKGTNSLKFLPLGDTTSVSMTSTWPSPSFFGNYLPESRVVEEDGFSADWQVSSLGRAIPSRWIGDDVNEGVAMESAFGVSLFLPIGLYQLTTRAAKYAVLFVAMTFVAYFLFEIIVGLSLHPLQYLLVGLANTMFFLLLLSLAEHIGFAWAYLASAVASSALITAYSIAVLGQRTRAFIMTTVLGVLYGFLYLTLNAESYAMLAGSAALWITLAIVMYLTRHVDWHGHGGSATDSASGQAGENV